MEVIATDLLRHIYKNLDNPMNKLFVKEKVFKLIRNIRHLREVGDGLGDIQYDYHKDKSGVYLFSMSRKNKAKDLVILYIPGTFIISPGNVETHLEYLSIFIIHLIEQGFQNPSIYVPRIEGLSTCNEVLQTLHQFVSKILNSNKDCKYVLAGDSIGGSLVLHLHRQIRKILNVHIILLVSPILKLFQEDTIHSTFDYFNYEELERWAEFHGIRWDFEHELKSCRRENLPKSGFIVSYGEAEAAAKNIGKFVLSLRNLGCKVKEDCRENQIHNWGVLNFYTEFLIDHREESLFRYSNQLARILLATSNGYFANTDGNIARNVTIDEERVY